MSTIDKSNAIHEKYTLRKVTKKLQQIHNICNNYIKPRPLCGENFTLKNPYPTLYKNPIGRKTCPIIACKKKDHFSI